MAKDIYFNDKKNGSEYTKQNTSWNSEEFKEKLTENGMSFPEKTKPAVRESSPAGKPPKKKRGKAKVILCTVLVVLLVFSGLTAISAAFVLRNYHASELENNAYISEGMLRSSPTVTNILLMGVDNANNDSDSRSDSMILLSIDSLRGKIKLTSFMRDMFVDVPGYGRTKLTHACQYGGAQLTVNTIEMNFGIRIDAYAKIGYDFLINVVDGIGGITVSEIDDVESAALRREYVYIDPGTNIHLDGREALQYCRIRKGQSDFQRTERQREVITLIAKKALRTNPLKLVSIASSVVSKIDCTIPKAELTGLLFKILPCLLRDMEQQQIPADGEWWNDSVNGMSVLQIDLEANKRILAEFLYD